MLPYALAIAVGLSSFVLFLTAFLFKDIHRQDDFFWSGIGLFYALVLWFCASSITGAVLLGQLAVVALLTAYFWQVLKLRKAIANPQEKDNLDNFSVVGFFQNLLKRSTPQNTPVKEVTDRSNQTRQTDNKSTSPAVEENKSTTQEVSPTKATSEKETTPTPVTNIQQDTTTKENSPPDTTSDKAESLTNTKLNDILDRAEPETPNINAELSSTPATSESPESKPDNPSSEEVTPSTTETVEESDEITLENVTIVEEETNWDDEVEDLPLSSVKIIKETNSEVSPETNSESNKTEETN